LTPRPESTKSEQWMRRFPEPITYHASHCTFRRLWSAFACQRMLKNPRRSPSLWVSSVSSVLSWKQCI
jgi:hypothetical protein